MNCVDYAINAITTRSDISNYVLDMAFKNPNRNIHGNSFYTPNQETVNQGIREKIIYGMVLPACNVMGGITENLDLSGSMIENMGGGNIYVNVPDFITRGRRIINVIKITPGGLTTGGGILDYVGNEPCGSGVVTDVLGKLLGSINPNTPKEYTNISMVGNNAFVIHNCPNFIMNFVAQVYMEFDENLSSINPRHYENFYTLCEYACKAYIYKNLRHPTSEAVILSGVSVDSIKDEIFGYSDAGENFNEYLRDEWTRCMVNSDQILKHKFITQVTQTRL